MQPWKDKFHPCLFVGRGDPMKQKDTSTGRRGQKRRERGKKKITQCIL